MFSCVRPQHRARGQVEANFSVVGKPISTLQIAVHLSSFDTSNGYITTRQNIAKQRKFRITCVRQSKGVLKSL